MKEIYVTPKLPHFFYDDGDGDKPHSCDLCYKKFALACNLRAHLKTHEGDPQDECPRCGKEFLCGPTKNGLCIRCKNPTINTASMGSAAEESSGNQTEDSTSPE